MDGAANPDGGSASGEGRQGSPRTVAISGSSGLIGSALSTALRGRGDQVLHLVRRDPLASADLPAGVKEARWDPQTDLDPAALDGVDAVVHLAGAGIGDRRWTEARKQELVDSRVAGTGSIARSIAVCSSASSGPAPRLLSGSAIGYYGDRRAEVLTEESEAGQGFLAELTRDWEAATGPAEQAGVPVVHLRTGIVLAGHGGALAKLMPLARMGLSGPLGSGEQYWAWITLQDHVRALLFLLDHPEITGAVNVTGPHPDPQASVVKALGAQLHRPAVVPAPTIALRLALGEMAGEILGSQRVLPTVLTGAGFSHDHPDLDSAMAWVVEQRRS